MLDNLVKPEDGKDIRFVAIDLDGTLFDNQEQLLSRASRLNKPVYDNGVHIIITTTRN